MVHESIPPWRVFVESECNSFLLFSKVAASPYVSTLYQKWKDSPESILTELNFWLLVFQDVNFGYPNGGQSFIHVRGAHSLFLLLPPHHMKCFTVPHGPYLMYFPFGRMYQSFLWLQILQCVC